MQVPLLGEGLVCKLWALVNSILAPEKSGELGMQGSSGCLANVWNRIQDPAVSPAAPHVGTRGPLCKIGAVPRLYGREGRLAAVLVYLKSIRIQIGISGKSF